MKKRDFNLGSLLYWDTKPKVILDIKFWTDYDNHTLRGQSNPQTNPITYLETEAAYTARVAKNQRNIDDIISFLTNFTSIKCKLIGHTDNVGTAAYNLDLSKRRVENIYNLVTGNPPKFTSRLAKAWKGLTEPIDTNSTEEGRQNNRRVELIITGYL